MTPVVKIKKLWPQNKVDVHVIVGSPPLCVCVAFVVCFVVFSFYVLLLLLLLLLLCALCVCACVCYAKEGEGGRETILIFFVVDIVLDYSHKTFSNE